MLKMKLKDGAVREVAEGTTIAEFVKNVSNSLAKKVLAAKLDGKTVDLMTPLTQDASIAFLTFEDEDGRWALRHTGSHILAQALKRLYKNENVKLAVQQLPPDLQKLVFRHSSVCNADFCFGKQRLQFFRAAVNAFNSVVDIVRLTAAAKLLLDCASYDTPVVLENVA